MACFIGCRVTCGCRSMPVLRTWRRIRIARLRESSAVHPLSACRCGRRCRSADLGWASGQLLESNPALGGPQSGSRRDGHANRKPRSRCHGRIHEVGQHQLLRAWDAALGLRTARMRKVALLSIVDLDRTELLNQLPWARQRGAELACQVWCGAWAHDHMAGDALDDAASEVSRPARRGERRVAIGSVRRR